MITLADLCIYENYTAVQCTAPNHRHVKLKQHRSPKQIQAWCVLGCITGLYCFGVGEKMQTVVSSTLLNCYDNDEWVDDEIAASMTETFQGSLPRGRGNNPASKQKHVTNPQPMHSNLILFSKQPRQFPKKIA